MTRWITRSGARRALLARLGLPVASVVVLGGLVAPAEALPLAATSTSTTFSANADAFVSTKLPDSNFGTWTELRLSNIQRTSYVRFPVQGLSGTVVSATLRLYATIGSSVGLGVYSVPKKAWTETAITYNTQPGHGSTPAAAAGPFAANGWVTVDVTALVKGNGAVTMFLATTDTTLVTLASRETRQTGPKLVVQTIVDTQAPTTPSGLSATAVSSSRVDLSWQPSSDDVGVAGYTVYRGGNAIANVSGSATTYSDTTVSPSTTYSYSVDAVDAAGNRSAKSASASVTTPAADPVLAAAGDIACDPADGSFNGGSGTATNCRESSTADLISQMGADAVLTLGDNQYDDGNPLAKWQQSYDPTWGEFKSITHPVPGNHEYFSGSAAAYWQYFGSSAGTVTQGWYSFDLGAWHIVALNGECDNVGGCGPGSPQETWLANDLAAHPAACTLAYWHEPRFTSGWSGNHPAFDAFWRDLYNAGAEVVLNGHDHVYERMAPMDPSGAQDAAYGIRQVTVGTGGKNHSSFPNVFPNSVARNSDTYGVLKLTLHSTGYDWNFIPISGGTYTDSGSAGCHPSPLVPFPSASTAPGSNAGTPSWPATDTYWVRAVASRPQD